MEQDPIYRVLFKYTKALSSALGHRDTLTRLHSERLRGLATEIGRDIPAQLQWPDFDQVCQGSHKELRLKPFG